MGKYLKVFTLTFRHTFSNWKGLVGLSLFLLICMLIFANLWEMLARKGGLSWMGPNELLWYIALNQSVLVATPRTERIIEGDFRSGRLAYYLPRPISYLGYVFAGGCGEAACQLTVLGVVTYLFTWFLAGPITLCPEGIVVSLVAGILAMVVSVLFKMSIGLLSFWMHEIDPVAWIWEKSLFALGGLLLPLTSYPREWQLVAKWTPFPVLLGGRSYLALDYSATFALVLLCKLIIWIAVAATLCTWLYRKGLKVITVEGG